MTDPDPAAPRAPAKGRALATLVASDGAVLAYRVEPGAVGAAPARPWLVFGHALAGDHTQWDLQAAKFGHAFNVLRFDIRGHGRSSAPSVIGSYALERLADDLRELLEALHIARCHYVGSSLGGVIGQLAALRFPLRIASLTLAGTLSRCPPDLRRHLLEEVDRVGPPRAAGALVPALLAQGFTPEFQAKNAPIMAAVAAAARATSIAGYVGCARALAQANLTTRLSSIACPVLVVAGAGDRRMPLPLSEEIAHAIVGARLKTIPEAAHLMNLEQAAAFNAIVADFLLQQH